MYEIPVNITIPPYEAFYAYIGALVSEIELVSRDLKYEIDNWITILLEPLLMQFDSNYLTKINAKDEINTFFGDTIEFGHIYTSSNIDPVYLVQIYAGNGILVSTASSNSLAMAEAKASSKALENEKRLQKLKTYIQLISEKKEVSSLDSLSPHTEENSYAYWSGDHGNA